MHQVGYHQPPYILLANYDWLVLRTRSESVDPIPLPRQSSRSPLSPAPTENTLIASESVPSRLSQSLKRYREESEAAVEDVERPAVRLRTETYVPPEKEALRPLDLFLLPFKSFARGFKESLKNGL